VNVHNLGRALPERASRLLNKKLIESDLRLAPCPSPGTVTGVRISDMDHDQLPYAGTEKMQAIKMKHLIQVGQPGDFAHPQPHIQVLTATFYLVPPDSCESGGPAHYARITNGMSARKEIGVYSLMPTRQRGREALAATGAEIADLRAQ